MINTFGSLSWVVWACRPGKTGQSRTWPACPYLVKNSPDKVIQNRAKELEEEVLPTSPYAKLRYALRDEDFTKARAEYQKLLGKATSPARCSTPFRSVTSQARHPTRPNSRPA